MKPFTNECRYDYPLNKDSVVINAGGYDGDFAAEIQRRHNCYVHVFEPCFAYCQKLRERFKHNNKIVVFHAALGGSERVATIGIKGSMTGMFADGPEEESEVVDIADYFGGLTDLLSLNCEGSEFEILERILECGFAKQFKAISCQFHPVVPDCEGRYAAIREGLLKTHHLTFEDGWIWQGWESNT